MEDAVTSTTLFVQGQGDTPSRPLTPPNSNNCHHHSLTAHFSNGLAQNHPTSVFPCCDNGLTHDSLAEK
ncbi:hypothetical protein E2C01_020828 [Portunus trituberculatus]|uniref:Uncharacterized protein n=1 Tax=Portunus trituberculatus TaxID=210409 RepID=A0A5B7E0Y2_PORTR|nr:hypothetical protein [Portunus trituberculatus]